MSEAFIGEIRIFAGNYAPQNWAFCNGQTMNIPQNQALFSLLGTVYGGDGVSTFALPNLQGRLAVSQGAGPGLSSYTLGQTAGTYAVTLSEAQIPAHNHNLQASSAPAATTSPANAYFATVPEPFDLYVTNNAAGVQTRAMDGKMLQNAGMSQPHANTMPSIGVTYIVALLGMFPSFN